MGIMKDDTQLFKQFMDNPDCKRWLGAWCSRWLTIRRLEG